jgi:HK97 family phage major capsid protein
MTEELKSMVSEKFNELQKSIIAAEAKGISAAEQAQGEVGNLATQFAELKSKVDGHTGSLDKLGEEMRKGLTVSNRPETFKSILAKSLNEQKAKLEALQTSHKSSASFDIELKAVGDMSRGNMAGGLGSFDRTYSPEIIANPFQRLHIRQLIPGAALTTETLVYPKLTTKEGVPAIQTEGSAKAQQDFDFTVVTESPVTIASFARVTKQMLRAMPQLSSFIQTQMIEDLLIIEDNELLNGPAGSNRLNGIATQASAYTPTAGTIAASAGADTYNRLINAIAQLKQLNYQPNGILMNTLDFSELLQVKTTGGEYTYPFLTVNAGTNAVSIYGVPVVETTSAALAVGQFIVGDWTRAAFLTRESLSVDISYDDANNFTTNKVTLRVEESVGLAVYHPQAFLKGATIAPEE